jgi:hypothetical protein
MPLQKIALRPGVNRESTSYAAEGGWYACDKVRFRSGQPEKIGGWTVVGEGTFLGVCRNLTEWVSLSNFILLGLGTNLKYYINSNQVNYDVTPIRLDTSVAPGTALGPNPFLPIYDELNGAISATATDIQLVSGTTFTRVVPLVITIGTEKIYVQNANVNTLTGCVRGYEGTTAATHASGAIVYSTWIVVNSPANGAAADDFVTFSGATAFGPYSIDDLNQNFQIKGSATNYVAVDVEVAPSAATAGGGASVVGKYEIPVGAAVATFGAGWGAGIWNSMVYNAGLSTLSSALNASATTVSLTSASSFPASGYVLIESEIIQYAGKSGNDLTGCTRGATSSAATSHMVGATVREVAYAYAVPSTSNTFRNWGTPATTGTNIPLRLWSADTFGQDLVYNVRDAGVYYWTASSGLEASGRVDERGVDITTLSGADAWSPVVASRVLVTDERHIVVLGTNDPTVGDTQDPLLVRWSEQEDPLIWEPTPTNTAGFQRLTYGSRLVTAEKTRQETLIWSDSALYSMRYLGPPYTFGFNTISAETTIASPNCVATANNITYWMGLDKFYAYSGRVDTLPCALRQYVFDDINANQIEQVYAGTCEKFNEVWWLYPSAESEQINRYVIYNYLEKLWYYGELARSAWYDSHIRSYPIATTEGKILYQEFGLDDGLTNPPSAIPAYIESADFDIGEGDKFSFVKRIIPDVDFIGSSSTTPSVTMAVASRNFPGQGTFQSIDSTLSSGSKVSLQVYNYTDQAWIRIRGRQMAFKISSDAAGVQWTLGVPRIDIREDGRR